MSNFYISDLHIGCQNKYEGRTLENDKTLESNWNNVVTNADTVYVLGDIGKVGNKTETEYIIKAIAPLKGKKILIAGNHDRISDYRLKQLFAEICDYKEICDNFDGRAYKLVLSHYPILMWNGQHKGTVLLYGHTHNTEEEYYFKKCVSGLNEFFKDKTLKGATDCPPAKAYNVGAMLPYINYCPRTLKEILENTESL